MKAAILLLSVTAICGAQSSVKAYDTTQETPTPSSAPQVRPALRQDQLATPQEQDPAARAKSQADKVRREAQEQEELRLAQETQSRGYWVDPITKLMWEGRDNGTAVTWHKAVSYCRNLRLAGQSDWSLATPDELASLVNKPAIPPERMGHGETFLISIGNVRPHVRGGLSLTGNSWSSKREINRFGKPYGDGWFFDFATSKPSFDLQNFRNTKYALCVRQP